MSSNFDSPQFGAELALDKNNERQNINKDPRVCEIMLRMFQMAANNQAAEVCIEPTEDKFEVIFFQDDGQDQNQEQTEIERFSAERNLLSPFKDLLSERAFPWPEPKEQHFAIASKRVSRIMYTPPTGPGMLFELTSRQTSSSAANAPRKQQIVLKVLRNEANFNVSDILDLTSKNKEFLINGCSPRTGIALANSSNSSSIFDAHAIAVALRPDLILFLDVETPEMAKNVVEIARDNFVVATVREFDPIQMIYHFSSLLNSMPEFQALFFEQICLAYVHCRTQRVCTACVRPTTVDPRTIQRIPEILRPDKQITYMFGRGCPQCGHRAYRGTIGIDSIVAIDNELRNSLKAGLSPDDLTREAYRRGVRSFLEDGLTKIYASQTSFEQVLDITNKLSAGFRSAILAQSKVDSYSGRGAGSIQSADGINKNGANDQGKQPSAQSNKGKVLIVEDNAEQRYILEVVFQLEGYQVVTASDGQAALDMLRKEPIDVVVCDILMPKVSGPEFIKELRQDTDLKDTPVLMLTASSNPEIEYSVLSLGADDFCEKTVKRKILMKRVERLMERRRAAAETQAAS